MAALFAVLCGAANTAAQCAPFFGDPLRYGGVVTPRAVVTADVNGDGALDIVVGVRASAPFQSSLRVFFGTLSNEDPPQYSVMIPPLVLLCGGEYGGPIVVAVTDMDQDGHLDLVALNDFSATISIHFGLGSGEFEPEVQFAIGVLPTDMTVADMNGDGALDIVASSAIEGVQVLLARLSAMPGEPLPRVMEPRVIIADNVGLSGLAVGDLTGDGLPDIVAANIYSTSIAILSNQTLVPDGPLVFSAPTFFELGSGVDWVRLFDLNLDGRLDVLAMRPPSTLRTMIAQTPPPGEPFSFRSPGLYSFSAFARAIAIDDVDGDGAPDVVSGQSVLRGLRDIDGPTGEFRPQLGHGLAPSVPALVLADLNADGASDMVYVFHSSSPTNGLTLRMSRPLAPTFVLQPSAVSVPERGTAVFNASVRFPEDVTYQWERDGTALVDGGPVSGAATSQLRIAPAPFSYHNSMIRCIASNPCGSQTSNSVLFRVSCRADWNRSYSLEAQDITLFLAAWFNGSPTADFDDSGIVNVVDIYGFLTAWFSGCY